MSYLKLRSVNARARARARIVKREEKGGGPIVGESQGQGRPI